MPRRECTKAIIAIPLSSVVLKFCNAYLMFKGVDFIFLSAYLMFLVVVFMCYCGYFMFSYLNNSYFFQNMIYNDLLSYVVIKAELVCKFP